MRHEVAQLSFQRELYGAQCASKLHFQILLVPKVGEHLLKEVGAASPHRRSRAFAKFSELDGTVEQRSQ